MNSYVAFATCGAVRRTSSIRDGSGVDYPNLWRLWAISDVGAPFCSADPITPIPTVANLAQTLKNTYDETIGKFPTQPPELKLLRDNFHKALKQGLPGRRR